MLDPGLSVTGDLAKAEQHCDTAQSLDEGKATPGLTNAVQAGRRHSCRRREQASARNARCRGPQTTRRWRDRSLSLRGPGLPDRRPARTGARLLNGCFADGIDLGPAVALRGLRLSGKRQLQAAFADAADGHAPETGGRPRLPGSRPRPPGKGPAKGRQRPRKGGDADGSTRWGHPSLAGGGALRRGTARTTRVPFRAGPCS